MVDCCLLLLVRCHAVFPRWDQPKFVGRCHDCYVPTTKSIYRAINWRLLLVSIMISLTRLNREDRDNHAGCSSSRALGINCIGQGCFWGWCTQAGARCLVFGCLLLSAWCRAVFSLRDQFVDCCHDYWQYVPKAGKGGFIIVNNKL